MDSPPFETVETEELHVVCDGQPGALGHPRVYLHIEADRGSITCPYCSRTFLYAGHPDHTRSERAVAAPVTGEPAVVIDLAKAH